MELRPSIPTVSEFAGQLRQRVTASAPRKGPNVSSGHGLHKNGPERAHFPSSQSPPIGQSLHSCRPLAAVYPYSESMQRQSSEEICPISSVVDPCGQAAQLSIVLAAVVGPYVPIGHPRHAWAPTASLNVPSPHSVHTKQNSFVHSSPSPHSWHSWRSRLRL
eukprot:367861-Rhodomonas_salina.2